jgi:preprotein translocase subunit SecA
MPLVEKSVMLQTIDRQWMEYLTQMEHFREGVGLRAYGQRDPLVEYKNEALEMFNELRDRIQSSIVAMIFHIQPAPRNTPPPTPQPVVRRVMESGPGELDGDGRSGRNGAPKPRRVAPVGAAAGVGGEAGAAKLGRNDPCWCGSGKKYKRCHGK